MPAYSWNALWVNTTGNREPFRRSVRVTALKDARMPAFVMADVDVTPPAGERLLNACRAGDKAAFETSSAATRKSSSRSCLGHSVGAQHVEDLAQEVFLRAYRALPTYDVRGPARVSTWLLTIRGGWRATRRRKQRTQLPLRDDEGLGQSPTTPETEGQRLELARALANAAAALPEDNSMPSSSSSFTGCGWHRACGRPRHTREHRQDAALSGARATSRAPRPVVGGPNMSPRFYRAWQVDEPPPRFRRSRLAHAVGDEKAACHASRRIWVGLLQRALRSPCGSSTESPSARGELTAKVRTEVELAPGAIAVLERGARLLWDRAGARQERGDVSYRLSPTATLKIETPTGEPARSRFLLPRQVGRVGRANRRTVGVGCAR